MLNELWSLAQALQNQSIAVKATSKLFKKNKKATGLRVYLKDSGEISSVEMVDKDLVSRLGRYELANGMGFPTFNLKSLREFSSDRLKDEIDPLIKAAQKEKLPAKATLQVIQTLLREPANNEARYLGDLEKRLNELPKEVQEIWGGVDIDDDFRAIRGLINALIVKKWKAEEFLERLDCQLLSYAEKLDVSELLELYNLCLKSKPPLLLDIEMPLGAVQVSSTEMSEYLNNKLLACEDSNPQNIDYSKIHDSLSGRVGKTENRFPSPSIPILGKVILYSNPKDSACQKRYGLQEGKSFLTTVVTSQQLQDALNFITHPNRSGKSWSSIPGDYGKSPCIVIAYPEQAPQIETGLASLFASEESREGVFESQAEAVIGSLRDFSKKYGDPTIRIFIIGKVDPGRTQIYLCDLLTKKFLEERCAFWAEAFKNIPPIKFILPPKEKGGISQSIYYSIPGPMKVLKILNLVFQRDGNSSSKTNTASLRDVYDLFLGSKTQNVSLLKRLLRATSHQIAPLLIKAGAMKSSRRWEDLKPENRELASCASAVLGMLLFFQGRKKERYMSDIAYNLGRLLQCADFIHKHYCFNVRNKGKEGKDKPDLERLANEVDFKGNKGKDGKSAKDLPPCLVGQSLFNAAMSRPTLALEQLAMRMRVYLNWAETVSQGESIGLVKWGLKQFKEISQAIPREEILRKFTEKDKAELFLGYLSDLNVKENLEGEQNE